MTIVGPRPERPSIAAEYEKVMPEFLIIMINEFATPHKYKMFMDGFQAL